MIRLLVSLFRPLTAIARELAIIRELYELDLASRETPVYRITETASKTDTEISYSGEDNSPAAKRKTWLTPQDYDQYAEPED